MWYKRLEAQKRFSFFFNAASFAAAFGGLLASAIGKMNGIRGYSAWRWIFILEGILTCVLAFVAFFVISDFPEDAKWLGEDDRAHIIGRLAADQGESEIYSRITWGTTKEAFGDWKMIPGALMYFGPALSAYGEQLRNVYFTSWVINHGDRTRILHPLNCRYVWIYTHPSPTSFRGSLGSRRRLFNVYGIFLG